MKIVGLLDCNNFYVSCECVFDPTLYGRPVAVLSNNDGSCISRSKEFKALNLPKRIPYYLLKRYASELGIVFRSSNYCLYGDMSNRVMRILNNLVPSMEQYSIDESFFHMDLPEEFQYAAFGETIRKRILKWTGIPCGIGFARTKTLAKIANHIGKELPSGIFVMPDDPFPILRELPLTEVWGISWRLEKQLEARGIRNAADLAAYDNVELRKQFNVLLAQTALELRGIPCIPREDFNGPVKRIAFSRSFCNPTVSEQAVHESLAHYTAIAAKKLRTLHEAASCAFIYTHYTAQYDREKQPGGYCGHVVVFPIPLSEPLSMMKYIRPAIRNIIIPGRKAMKTGVVLFELSRVEAMNGDLFDRPDEKNITIAAVMDRINDRYGRNTLFPAGAGIRRPWNMKRNFLSPCYTTNWNELPEVK